MDLLTEIRKLKSSRLKRSEIILPGIENPSPRFEKVLAEVATAIREECRQRKCTYPELLEDIRKIDPQIIKRFLELEHAINCDVYGRWCAGTLTEEELQEFYQNVEEWRASAIEMLKVGI